MAARDDPEDRDVEPWERQTRASCGTDEPPRLHALFLEYLRTRPRSVRVALARSRKLEGAEAAAVRASGALQRASRFWRWPERAAEWDKNAARVEKAALDARRAASRRRRLDQLDKLNDALGLRLDELAEKASLESLLRLHTQEREEYAAPDEGEHGDVGLPRLGDVVRPPENNEPEGGNL